MKKFMMGIFILLFVVAVSCVGGVKKAEAIPINGGVKFGMTATLEDVDGATVSDATLATQIDFGVDASVSTAGTGSFAPFVFNTLATFTDFTFFPSPGILPVEPLWTMSIGTLTASFDLTSVTVGAATNASTLRLSGFGDLHIIDSTGGQIFETIQGSWSLSADTSDNGLTFGFSSTTTAAVPEPGTIALLGIGLAGLVGVGVRRRAKKNAA